MPLDGVIAKLKGLGVSTVELGTGNYPGDPHCKLSMLEDKAARKDFKQMLDDLNVRRNTWWGYGLHVVFDNMRIPFTAVGFRYDVNHGRWHGPNAGN